MPVIAAVDAGSNAIRLSIVRAEASGATAPVDQRRYALRLGASTYARGTIEAHMIARLLVIFSDIATRLCRAGVERYRAVATAGLRDAANGTTVVRTIRKTTGVRLEIIDGAQESNLVHQALAAALGSVPQGALLMDMGGGSLELISCATGRALSLPLGTVRLLQTHPYLGGVVPAKELGKIRRTIAHALGPRRRASAGHIVGIGTGGNLDALARLLPLRGYVLPAIQLNRLPALIRTLATLNARERAARFGLRSDRADIVLTAALVLEAVAAHFHLTALVVPGTGLRQALLQNLATQAHAASGVRLRPLSASGRRLYARSQSLFAALTPLHNLWPPAAHVLSNAAADLAQKGPQAPLAADAPVHFSRPHSRAAAVLAAVLAICAQTRQIRPRTPLRLDWLKRPFVLHLGVPAGERAWVERLLRSSLGVRVEVR